MADVLLDRSVLASITSVERRLAAAMAPDVERHGVSLEQWRVLDFLVSRDGRTMSDIADAVVVPAPTLTKLVDRLVASNLVHRRGDPADRRRVLVLLTPRGRALRQQLQKVVDQHQRRLAEALGEDGYADFAELLERLEGDASQ